MNALANGLAPRVWFAIVGAPAAWSVQLLAGWLIADFVCGADGARNVLGAADTAEIVVSLASLVVAAVAFACGVQAWRDSGNARLTFTKAATRPDFMAAVALLVSASFLLATLWGCLGALLLPVCERIR